VSQTDPGTVAEHPQGSVTVSGGAENDLATVDPRDIVRGVEQQT
jgi:hypothetical protein